MDWKLSDSRAIWIQLAEQLTERIVSGIYPMGEKLKSVRELASEAGVNPNTMQRALSQLDAKGLTETNRTSGRIVTGSREIIADVRKELAMEKINAFLNGMKILGFNRNEIVELIKEEEADE